MRTDRAAEIISSNFNIEVVHNGNSVWLEEVNKETGTAKIMVLGSKEKREVSIAELQETDNFEIMA